MIEEIYDYLREYGFSKEELKYFELYNEKIFFVNLETVKRNISFLTEKGLNKKEILYVCKENPFMITVSNSKIGKIDKILIEELGIGHYSLKNIIINNPDTYTVSVSELSKIVEYLKENNYSNEKLKILFIDNPKVINMSFNSFKNNYNI